ncbi:N-formylglutamate amidohydrolase [Legionella jordanis]|uniref:N-formylglutamate amidohydrolase n=1 Tax=Legionella jordanis TaxID=456 RepID=UPI000EFE29A0|nr:N-formylglutamate amidohydrolase [Legionella jordanis]RMX17917.1 N-formylglutamate amidohydrolase [Legionella jordanis]
MKRPVLVLSCEHAVNSIPEQYAPYFYGYEKLLLSHRAIDFGALDIAKYLSEQFNAILIQAKSTRLLIDCNRSLNNSSCFSEITRSLPNEIKQEIIAEFYLPFRKRVEDTVTHYLASGRQVLHCSVHSFTPIFNGLVRNADLAFLYDPRRSNERLLAKGWQSNIKYKAPELKVRLNYPYRGISDGFTTHLRKQFSNEQYLGIEIESNQAMTGMHESLAYLCKILAETLQI